jgi:hypothetical protein
MPIRRNHDDRESGHEPENRSEIDPKNAFRVGMEDLPEEDQCRIREEMRHELEEVETAKMHEKLSCYYKTPSSVVQKADMAKASTSKVYAASLTPEDLVHLIDISVASKYGVDLSQLTWVLAEDVRHTLDAFKQDWDNGLPRQI